MVLLAAVQSASAFSLGGPLTAESAWQTPVIGYQLGGDNNTPRNLGEEYRWNTPVLYYAFDSAFLNYFGSNGVEAVNQAMRIYNSVTNLSSYSKSLTEFPLDARRYNYRAVGLNLLDLKTLALMAMAEQLGLSQPTRWTWTLHDREPGNTCPATAAYAVTKRNFDPETWEYSSYVNGTLLSYRIIEFCTGPNPLAEAVEFVVDPLSDTPAVADFLPASGEFYIDLTRDDVGGLRYMLRTNNMNVEAVDTNAVQIATTGTNGSSLQVIVTSSLNELAQAAATNAPAQFQALFPNIQISGFSSSFQLVVSSNVVAYFTNYPYMPAGTPPTLIVAMSFTTNIQQIYSYSFANVVTNHFYPSTRVATFTTNVSASACGPYSLPGQVCTNVSTRSTTTAAISGDYYVIPTNICNFQVLSNFFTQVTGVTNTVTTIDPASGQAFTQVSVAFYTNYWLLARLTPCSTGQELRQGMNGIRFVQVDFDSLLGTVYPVLPQVITNKFSTTYTLKRVFGNQIVTDTFQRTVIRPDIVFGAWDGGGVPGNNLLEQFVLSRSTPSWVRGTDQSAPAGPGIIQTPVLIQFNKVGPYYFNSQFNFIDEANATISFVNGSFDGTTNAPIVYPNGTSIVNLENQVLMQIVPGSLPDGNVGALYSVQLQGLGGLPPYTFSLSPDSAGLPPGLTLSGSGLISGTPTQADTFDFNVRLTESGARVVDKPYSITIAP